MNIGRQGIICLLLLTVVSQSLALRHLPTRDYVKLRKDHEQYVVIDQEQSYDTIHYRHPEKDNAVIIEAYIEQQLDHFNGGRASVKTFQQRYFYSDRFVVSDESYDGPSYVFLCVGGEGPDLDWSVLVDSVHCTGDMIELARKLHDNGEGVSVHLFALEHRYYGRSYPQFGVRDDDSAVSNKNLIYLSSKQALADLAHFVSSIGNQLGESYSSDLRARRRIQKTQLLSDSATKWVTFGGSYPGMLAAWARLKYPHMIYAAVSNSAPVTPTLDFYQYNNMVASDLMNTDIGGSRECLDIIREGHKDISEALIGPVSSDETRSKIANLFNVCEGETALKDEMNARLFAGDGVIFIPAQANDPSCDSDLCNIEKICNEILGNEYASPVERLADVARRQNTGQCVVVDWYDTLEFLSSPAAIVGGTRSWIWQTCTEFGFFQTCDNDTSCPFSRLHEITQDLDICNVAFDVKPDRVKEGIENTIEFYGGNKLSSTRIMFVNGDVDPWSAQAITKGNNSDDESVVMVPGASHHFWTHPIKESDTIWIQAVREMIYVQVGEWLVQDYIE